MPSRRRLAEIADIYLRHSLQLRQQEQQAELQRQTAAMNEKINSAQQVLGRGLSDPQFGLRLSRSPNASSVLPEGIDPSILARSGPELTSDISKEISSAKDFSALPTREDIAGRAVSSGVDEPLQIARQAAQPMGEDELPSSNFNLQSGPTIQTLTNQRNSRRDAINTANELEDDRKLALEKGLAREKVVGENAGNQQVFPDVLARDKEKTAQEHAQKLEYERSLSPVLTSRAAATAGATKRAELAPDIVAKEVDRFAQMEAVRRQNGVPTDAQSRAAGLLNPLIQADTGARNLETNGAMLQLGTQTLGNMPGMNKLISDQQRQYLQNAQNFLNIATLIMTGVTARPDEYTRYTGTMFGLSGDDPTTLKQKQATREAFIKSVMQRAARGQGGTIEEVLNELARQGSNASPGAQQMLNELQQLQQQQNGR